MISSAHRRSIGWLTLAIPPLLWAGNIAVGRAASAQVPPMMLALSRQLIAMIVLLPIGWRVMRRDFGSYWQHRWPLVRLSLSGMVCFNALVYLGLHFTTASNAQLLNSAIPVLIIVFSALFLGQRLTILQTIGLLISCSGVLTIIFHGDWARFLSLEFARGDAIIFVAMASFALFSIWLRSFPAEVDRLGLLGAQFGIAVAVLTPLAMIEYRLGYRALWDPESIGAMIYVSIAAGLTANLLYMFGVARVGPTRAGLFIHLVPFYGSIISITFLGEELHWFHAIGMAAILVGLTCTQRTAPNKRDPSYDTRRTHPNT